MAAFFSRYLHTISSPSPPKSSIVTYLTDYLGFSKPRALSLSNRFSSPETNPKSVINFLNSLGFAPSDVQTCVNLAPQILFSDVEATLKPRIQFFRDLGLANPDLRKFISKNPNYLSDVFDTRLKPCVDIIEKYQTNENILTTLRRCNWFDLKNPEIRVSANITYLEQCGIVGSQLVTVMTRQPRLLIMGESELKKLVSQVLDLGVPIDSGMFVHALYTLSCVSDETFERKLDLLRRFGFSKDESLDMFRRAPGLFRVSESKLKLGIGFFLDTLKFEKEMLVRRPTCLMYSLEDRVIPRYKILQYLMSKKGFKKKPKLLHVMCMSEDNFMEKFIRKNKDDAEELLLAYKGGDLDVSED